MVYYSQHGEDFLLDQIFKNQDKGFFVEVGCIDGRRFSNTLSFEERGWKGMCIEAHSDYIGLLRENRPNSIICHCAAGETDEDEVIFYANDRGTLSTLDRSQESRFQEQFGSYFSGFEEQKVPKITLSTLFKEHGVSDIDFISLDVEGYEVEVLKGITLSHYSPKVLIIESDSPAHEKELDKILLPQGYVKSVSVGLNIFYLKNKSLAQSIVNRIFEVELVHTRHPLDSGGDRLVKVEIDTREKKLKTLISRLTRLVS